MQMVVKMLNVVLCDSLPTMYAISVCYKCKKMGLQVMGWLQRAKHMAFEAFVLTVMTLWQCMPPSKLHVKWLSVKIGLS
jgi:hypothetical protein